MVTAKEKVEILSLSDDSPDSRDKVFETFYELLVLMMCKRKLKQTSCQSGSFELRATRKNSSIFLLCHQIEPNEKPNCETWLWIPHSSVLMHETTITMCYHPV